MPHPDGNILVQLSPIYTRCFNCKSQTPISFLSLTFHTFADLSSSFSSSLSLLSPSLSRSNRCIRLLPSPSPARVSFAATAKLFAAIVVSIYLCVCIVLYCPRGAVIIFVQNFSGYVSTDKDGNWICTDGKHHKPDLITNPVEEAKRLVSVLEDYLEQRGVSLPEGYLSYKVICPNPKFRCGCRSPKVPGEGCFSVRVILDPKVCNA